MFFVLCNAIKLETLWTHIVIFYFYNCYSALNSQFITEKENLCLYGFPSEQWEVNLPAEEVPPELPEPALGINFARDGMQEKDWLSLVAVHSDAWLLAVAFYFGARFGFDKADRYASLHPVVHVQWLDQSQCLHGIPVFLGELLFGWPWIQIYY